MKDFSNRYIFIFSVVMVVSVAVLLSLTALLLQPKQEKNVEVEKKMNILSSINVTSTKSDAVTLYDKYIRESFVINTRGQHIEGVDAFTVSLRAEHKKPLEDQYLPVFTAVMDNGDTLHIFPLEGKGLWGPIWGYVALKPDMNTIAGATFDHKGETPGLGAEINTTEFESQFLDKWIYEGGSFISVAVVKGGADKSDRHEVDGISGGTITSKALEAMLREGLVKYENYFMENRK
ncbi:MAG: NADH:ubiquinone reductase (Na(+)-transporting) subunit C [Bacteroidales bacterium]|jgi:Na+-transporting NADH:ubiquinone oxidoreductase subunit C|nr:NADH:ubiquinone reductase (Na(+)-transporting) subunit C [Bacteroidales bacterium]